MPENENELNKIIAILTFQGIVHLFATANVFIEISANLRDLKRMKPKRKNNRNKTPNRNAGFWSHDIASMQR